MLGVDDFGFRKGNAPGTIMVDLERHKIVDLFEGHSAGSIAQWLRQHPEVEVVSRDRSPVCRAGIDTGAPEARQVTDRWHLLHNLTQLLEEFLLQKRPALRDATSEAGTAESQDGVGSPDLAVPNDPGSWRARKEEAARKRHERLVEQWRNIRRLHLAGGCALHRQKARNRRSHRLPLQGPERAAISAESPEQSKRARPPRDVPAGALERGMPQREETLLGDSGERLRP